MNKIKVIVPSNIAFLKYWGKDDSKKQWPSNNSISMTLKNASTTGIASLISAKDHELTISGKAHSRDSLFAQKAFKHLDFLWSNVKGDKKIQISLQNSFPAGCGIASSASSMGALTLCALSLLENQFSLENQEFLNKVIANSRLGSGSACRSFYSGYVLWEKSTSPETQTVSQLFPKNHWKLSDLIVICSGEEKKLSSSKAHELVKSSPLFSIRQEYLTDRCLKFQNALKEKNMDTLGPLLEQEALDIHTQIMTSKEPFSYIQESTILVLSWVIRFREKTGMKVYFTLDAGPNPHLIVESDYAEEVSLELKKAFPQFRILEDEVGDGGVFEKL